jgi:hypothetical protein
MKHTQPIITNARTGRPVSTNTLRKSFRRLQRERLILALALFFFWITVLILLFK